MATAFSDEQEAELLAILEVLIFRAAVGMSTVSSTKEMTFPAPTEWAGFPAAYTTLCSAAPPVATAKSQTDISSEVFPWLVSLIHCRRSSGAPTFFKAFRAIWMVRY